MAHLIAVPRVDDALNSLKRLGHENSNLGQERGTLESTAAKVMVSASTEVAATLLRDAAEKRVHALHR